jgi:hypothetical protein
MERFILAFAIAWLAINLACTAADRIVGADSDGDNKNNNDQDNKSGWNPKDEHPCTVERISMNDFLKAYGAQGGLPPLFPRPLVITKTAVGERRNNNKEEEDPNSSRNSKFQKLTRAASILDSFPANFTVTLSSSNSFSEHRRTLPFANYLEDVRTGPALEADMKSNETWYLFGETYSAEWKHLLESYELPPCQACIDEFDDSLVALSFGIGNSGSGVQWHVHGPGFSEAIHGRKHWILYSFDNEPRFHPDQTSLNWMHYDYSAFETLEDRPLECTLHPGDIIYL